MRSRKRSHQHPVVPFVPRKKDEVDVRVEASGPAFFALVFGSVLKYFHHEAIDSDGTDLAVASIAGNGEDP